ncbi:Secreted RxLR effector protein 78-like 4 [Homarus americanus]|uniref:Secreted RxLR effector protein 78-like 4 n=1 Tax=Homarus americanus TaxID=6706 RepID=A0A8J5JG98_HOMAM|nr:Secreted RxLR effector protein 78-like 4 [Homarus americanus]
MHDGMQARVLVGGVQSEPVSVQMGVRQGSVLAPVLFNIILLAVTQLSHNVLGPEVVRLEAYTKTLTTQVIELQHADDWAIMTHNRESMQRALDVISDPIEIVNQLKYLGSTLITTCSLDMEIQTRINLASAAFGSLRTRVFLNNDLKYGTKTAVYLAEPNDIRGLKAHFLSMNNIPVTYATRSAPPRLDSIIIYGGIRGITQNSSIISSGATSSSTSMDCHKVSTDTPPALPHITAETHLQHCHTPQHQHPQHCHTPQHQHTYSTNTPLALPHTTAPTHLHHQHPSNTATHQSSNTPPTLQHTNTLTLLAPTHLQHCHTTAPTPPTLLTPQHQHTSNTATTH